MRHLYITDLLTLSTPHSTAQMCHHLNQDGLDKSSWFAGAILAKTKRPLQSTNDS